MSSKKPKTSQTRNIRVICITGSPGCGKTTLADMVKTKLGTENFEFINVGSAISEKKLYSEWDDEMNCSIFDDDLVRKEIRKSILAAQQEGKKGVLIEFHSLSFLRKKLIDQIIVLRTDNSVLWDRLEKRGYSKAKIQENVQAEIFMECYNEVVDEFGDEIVQLRESNSEQDLKENVEYISKLLVNS